MPAISSASVAKVHLPGARIGDHLGARAFDDDLAVMQHGDALGKASAVSMSCSIITMVTSRGMVSSSARRSGARLRQPGERLVEQEHFGLLRQRHGEFEPAPLAVGGFDHDALGAAPSPTRSSAACAAS